jgi:hypothetical protein
MATENANKEWMNSNGNFIPKKNIPKIYRERDKVVMKITKRMEKLERQMKAVKAANFKDVDAYLAKLAKTNGVQKDIKGNITLSSYDNLYRVELNRNEIEGFDEQLNVAKQLIDECIIKWSKGSDKNLIPVITEAFKLDNNKRFNTNAIWNLTKLNIKDPTWKKAVDLITNSRQKVGSKQYMQVASRKSHKSLFKSINMNFSSMDLPE